MKLRPYQSRAIAEITANWRNKSRSCLCVAPTGAGKTILGADLCLRGVKHDRRILFCATQIDLIHQTRDKLVSAGLPKSEIGLIQGESDETRDAPVQVASLQTLADRRWWKKYPYDVAIFDEAHTSIYYQVAQRVLDARPDAKILGLTATPYSAHKKKSLADFFDSLVTVATPRELMAQGYLVPAKYYAAGIEPDTSNVTIASTGDYDTDELQQACNTPLLIADALQWRDKLAAGRPTIAFCTGIKHARAVADVANGRGIPAAVVTGATSRADRRRLYGQLRSGDIQLLASVGVLTTGFDEPAVSCVMLMRKTTSRILHEQMIGRGLRPLLGKNDCIVLDQARNCLAHGTPEMIWQYTLDPSVDDRNAAEAGLRCCPACSNYSRDPQQCDACGFEFVPIDLAASAASDSDGVPTGEQFFGFRRLTIAATQADAARDAYRQFRRRAFDRGYKFGWAYHRFKEWCEERGIQAAIQPEWAADCFDTGAIPDVWDRFFSVYLQLEGRKNKLPANELRRVLELEFARHPEILGHIRQDFSHAA